MLMLVFCLTVTSDPLENTSLAELFAAELRESPSVRISPTFKGAFWPLGEYLVTVPVSSSTLALAKRAACAEIALNASRHSIVSGIRRVFIAELRCV